eukprot:757535-Hanusia_phi.AAC.4
MGGSVGEMGTRREKEGGRGRGRGDERERERERRRGERNLPQSGMARKEMEIWESKLRMDGREGGTPERILRLFKNRAMRL